VLDQLTTPFSFAIIRTMKAELLLQERHQLGDAAFVQLRIWRVPRPVRGSDHDYKYSLAYAVFGECVLRYDNEAGKDDHKHVGQKEFPHLFTTPAALLADFWRAMDQWTRSHTP
jgi:hypothetical protein